MTAESAVVLTEDELDTLVSIAIRRAELLEDAGLPTASEAWHEVSLYEEQLAIVTSPGEITGGIARIGAVRAALAAGDRDRAECLADHYLGEAELPSERRNAIKLAFREDRERRARHFPALAQSGRLVELDEWRTAVASSPNAFPWAA